MLYAAKIGPIETTEGDLNAYFAFHREVMFPPVFADSDEDGLRKLAALAPGEAKLCCDETVAAAGKRLGFEPSPPPDWVDPVLCSVAVRYAHLELDLSVDHDLFLEFVLAAVAFCEAAPWEFWSEAEVLRVELSGKVKGRRVASLIGGDGEKGLLLARDIKTLKTRRAKHLRSNLLWLSFQDGPTFAADLLGRAFGVEEVPLVLKVNAGKPRRVTTEDILEMTSILWAVSSLTPHAREVTGEAGWQVKRATTARVRAPRTG